MVDNILDLLNGNNRQYLFSTHGSVRITNSDKITIEMFKTLGAKQTVHIEIPKCVVHKVGILAYLNTMAGSIKDTDGDYKIANEALNELLAPSNHLRA
ncbi:hypothetical protein ACPV5J_12925 [Vibrio rotiferianus]|uniref:hypothetical protein n=1 Tax=Vibrio rotiferianus TaxID=190895 RepID=UPI00406A2442